MPETEMPGLLTIKAAGKCAPARRKSPMGAAKEPPGKRQKQIGAPKAKSRAFADNRRKTQISPSETTQP
ncbi:hypothetical protein HUJ05_007240 [Dendroctonus ponderosae]|nr:hypothetical protein HUJ05_007240 [Dendroctonus ponderosae]